MLRPALIALAMLVAFDYFVCDGRYMAVFRHLSCTLLRSMGLA